MLWLPEDDSSIGLTAGFHNLTEEDGSDDNGIALDINERHADRRRTAKMSATEEAIVWTISSGTVTGTLIDFSSSVFDDSAPSPGMVSMMIRRLSLVGFRDLRQTSMDWQTRLASLS